MLRTGNRQIDERYQIIEEIHHGSNSIVYSAKDRKLSSYWAIKKIPKHNSAASTLMAEAEILTGLNHPALPRIRDIEEDNNSFYIIMDLVQGENLRTYLKLQHPIPQNLVVSWGIRLCDVLSYLHKNKIIYRDMKPSNIMMSKESKYNIKLIDFGIARVLKNPDMEDTTALGSFGYAAPEQYGDDAKTDERTDVYGLGVTLFQLLTGINPSRYDKEELNPRLERPDLSSGLSRVILKATNKDPDRRYQSAKEFKYALQHYQEYDTEYLEMKKMTIKKMMVFTITSVICFMISGGLFIGDKFETNRQYDSLISETQNAEALKNAIAIKPSEPKAYVLLLESYGEELDDAEFSEFSHVLGTTSENLSDRDKNEVFMTLGEKILTSYSDKNPSLRARLSLASPYFKAVKDSKDEDFKKYKAAVAYSNMAEFYDKYVTQNNSGIIHEASKKDYKHLLSGMKDTLRITREYKGTEQKNLYLTSANLAVSLIAEEADGMYEQGVDKTDLLDILGQIETDVQDINSDIQILQKKKSVLLTEAKQTEKTVSLTYSPHKEVRSGSRRDHV